MKRYMVAILLLGTLSLFGQTSQGQTADPTGIPPYGPTHVGGYDPLERNAFGPPRVDREPQVITQGFLAVSRTDRTAFASLLEDKNSGLIRLIPIEVHHANYRSERNPIRRRQFIFDGGPFFSFAGRTHAMGFGSDIALGQGKLSVGIGGVNYGMLTNLGDTPLEKLTLSDARLKSLAAFDPPENQALAQDLYTRITSSAGLNLNEQIFRHQLPAESNATYLLRSVIDRQSDVLVAFRLVRKDNDDSAVIAWRLLKQYPTPKMKRSGKRFR